MNGKIFPDEMPLWQGTEQDYLDKMQPSQGNVPYAVGMEPQQEVLENNFMQGAQQEAIDQAQPMTEAEQDAAFGPGVVASGQTSQADFDAIRGNMPSNYNELVQDEANQQAPSPLEQAVPNLPQLQDVAAAGAAAPQKALSPQEQMLAEYKAMRDQDKKDLDEARSSDRMLKMGGAVGDALATILNARGQMNVKAPGVQVQQGAGLGKIADMFQTAPDKSQDIKSRREDLLAQFKAAKTGEMTPYQELALQLQRERLGLQSEQEAGRTKRAGESLALSREKAGQLSDTVAGSFADMEIAKKEAERLLPTIKDAGLGILGTPYEKTRSAVGLPSKEYQKLEQDYAGVRNKVRHALFGSALTPAEKESFAEELNDISISQTGFEDNLTNLMSRMDRAMADKASVMSKTQPLKKEALKPFLKDEESAPVVEVVQGGNVFDKNTGKFIRKAP